MKQSNFIENIQVGANVKGIVKNIKPYGAFIDIGDGVVGLVHIEDLSVARIKTPYERVKIGQEINTKVKNIDKDINLYFVGYTDSDSTVDLAKQYKKVNEKINAKIGN